MLTLLSLSLLAAPVAPSPTRDALIVTYNGAAGLDRPDLRYADDDGLQYAALFRQAFGDAHVTLLTRFDHDTEALHGPLAVADGPPTREALFSAVAAHARLIAGRGDAELYLIFAGHGDVREGEGFITLADGPLTAMELDREVLTPLDGARVHLIIDSCNSYFMVAPRKPGGRVFRAEATAASKAVLERHPNVGVLLSTSAEAVTYEWSEIQSGIFSYVVRSGLRGAADADADGRVSYAELRAFIGAATQSVENEAYRPRVFARGPNAAATLFTLPDGAPNRLLVEAGAPHRLTVRDGHGVRLVDLHSDGSRAVQVWLPEARLSIEELSGRRLVRREIGPSEQRALGSLPEAPDTMAARGESPVFRNMFARPFGQSTLEQAASQPEEEEAYGVSRADMAQYREVLAALAAQGRAHRYDQAWLYGVMSAGFLAAGVPMAVLGAYDASSAMGAALVSAGVTLAAVGLPVSLARKSAAEKLFAEFSQLELKSETARSIAAARIAQLLVTRAESDRRIALTAGILGVGAAAGLGVLSALELAQVANQARAFASYAGPGYPPMGMSYNMVIGAAAAGLAASVLVQAIRVLVSVPPKIESFDELIERPPPKPRGLSFDSLSVGSDGKRVSANAGFRF